MRLRSILPTIKSNAKFFNKREKCFGMRLIKYIKNNKKSSSTEKYANVILKRGLTDAKKELKQGSKFLSKLVLTAWYKKAKLAFRTIYDHWNIEVGNLLVMLLL